MHGKSGEVNTCSIVKHDIGGHKEARYIEWHGKPGAGKSGHYCNYFREKDHELKSRKEFDASLFKNVQIRIIDNINFDSNLSTIEKEKLCEEREGYW